MNTLARAFSNKLQLVVTVALVATPMVASAADTPSGAVSPPAASRLRYHVVDDRGAVVGELTTDGSTLVRLRSTGNGFALRAPQERAVPPVDERVFHPDYSKSLTAGQMTAAWQAELDRLFPPPAIGGG